MIVAQEHFDTVFYMVILAMWFYFIVSMFVKLDGKNDQKKRRRKKKRD